MKLWRKGPRGLVGGLMVGLTLAACAPQRVPDSGAGVGFTDFRGYEIERARREAALTGAGGYNPAATPGMGTLPQGGIPSSELAAAGIGARPGTSVQAPVQAPVQGQAPLDATGLDRNRTSGVQASPANAAPIVVNNPGISDEQDFSAVAERESIQSDAERRAAQQAAYEQVAPTALPGRSGDTGPNLVAFALNTTNRRGQEIYSRSLLSGQGRYTRNCADYRSPDDAQRDFLSRGGPDRDPRGIDPDGDGFACGWDPAPFRAAVGRGLTLAQRNSLSPNCGPRRGGARPDMVVIHYTAMDSCAAARDRLCDPAAEVSAHYLIGADGAVLALVPEELRAWHAGAGRWGEVRDVNSRSIGIELANRGNHPFAAAQMGALEGLLAGIMDRWTIAPERVIGHSDMAPTRKGDPGPRFDWRRLALQGLSVWPVEGARSDEPGDIAAFAARAVEFGYDPDLPPNVLLSAFRQRFRPWKDGAGPSATEAALIADLARRFPVDRAGPGT